MLGSRQRSSAVGKTRPGSPCCAGRTAALGLDENSNSFIELDEIKNSRGIASRADDTAFCVTPTNNSNQTKTRGA